MFALGSSLVVAPAAELPRRAKQAGAWLIIINRDATPHDSFADVVIHDSIGQVLSDIDCQLAAVRGADSNVRTR